MSGNLPHSEGLATWDPVRHTSLILTHRLLSGLTSKLPRHQRLPSDHWSLATPLPGLLFALLRNCGTSSLSVRALPCLCLPINLNSWITFPCTVTSTHVAPKELSLQNNLVWKREVKLANHYSENGNITRLSIFLTILL